MKLVIVESPTKAKTIEKFLGKGYKIESSFGHVRDLPKSKLGIDLENNFEPQYIIPVKAKKNVRLLKETAAKADEVILATDEDREGEAIAWHLTKALGLEGGDKIKRIVFHEITETAIQEALKSPRSLDPRLVDAQQGRRVLDRLVGYKLSPFLWKKIMRGLSAGRVQSVALRLIIEREEEIKNFKPTEYWELIAALTKKIGGQAIEARLMKIDDRTLAQLDIQNQEMAEKILSDLKGAEFKVAKIERKEIAKNPLPPLITSTLQQEGAKRLGFSSKKTMFLAQRLYEKGLITYMRTDSVNLSQESLAAAKRWLTENLGEAYASQAPRIFKTKSRLAQEAHEAVRPTNVFIEPDKNDIEDIGEKKLYKLIWQRFVASQMPQAIISSVQTDISAKNYTFRASGNVMKFNGYLKIWPQKFEERELPPLEENESLLLTELRPSQHFTEPPARYNEASLIKTLEEFGIGRPSTYAPTISVIQTRNYVEKKEKKFYPTEIGTLVNKVLVENFPAIVDINFTAKMEEELDGIAEGKSQWQDVIREFYVPFAENLEKKYLEVSKKEIVPEEAIDEKCDKCGKPMVIKYGRFGRFIACTGFPECKNTKQLPKEPPKLLGMKCPKCEIGDVIERKVSRGRVRGKVFWGCNRYPTCDYASWTNPLNPPAEKEKTVGEKTEKEEEE
ncbi:MAG: type I DNA topoisomerase [bacterium]|nr:type I DNA topoisomerase [bacterium]